MPRPEPTIGEQLAALLADTGLSQRELARRIALEEQRDPEDFKRVWNAWLRWLPKVLRPDSPGGVRNPTRKRLELVERAAGRPGYFKVPTPQQREGEAAWRRRVDARLEELSETAVRFEDLALVMRVLRLLATGNRREALRELSEAEVLRS